MATLKTSPARAMTIFANIFRSGSCRDGGMERWASLRQRFLQRLGDFAFLYFAGSVIRGLAIAIQHHHVRNVSLIKFLHQLFLRRRARTIEIDHDELHPALALFVEFHGAPRLPLGIETPFAVAQHVGRLAPDCPVSPTVNA